MTINDHYKMIRQQEVPGQPVALLDITAEQMTLAYGTTDEPKEIWTYPLGSDIISKKYFHHSPPTPNEVEYAINTIEDTIIPIQKKLNPQTKLYTFNPVIAEIANLNASAPHPSELDIKEMESVFSRLALIISGRPSSTDNLPGTPKFAATLLLLREIMHHLRFNSIFIYIFAP